MLRSHQIICSRLSDRTAKKLGTAPIACNGLKPVRSDWREQIYLKIFGVNWSIRETSFVSNLPSHGKANLYPPKLAFVSLGSAVLRRSLMGSGWKRMTPGRKGPNQKLAMVLYLVASSTNHSSPFSFGPGCCREEKTTRGLHLWMQNSV